MSGFPIPEVILVLWIPAERAWRKLSFGIQSEKGSRFIETMLTVVDTCRQQDRSALAFVTESVTVKFAGQPASSLRHDP